MVARVRSAKVVLVKLRSTWIMSSTSCAIRSRPRKMIGVEPPWLLKKPTADEVSSLTPCPAPWASNQTRGAGARCTSGGTGLARRGVPAEKRDVPVTPPASRAYTCRRPSRRKEARMKKNLLRSLLVVSVLALPAMAWAGNALVHSSCPFPCPFCP
jgi:hypothetical protein